MIPVVMFVIASCGAMTTPQGQYAEAMQPALERLPEWQNDFSTLESLLTDPLDADTGVTRLQIIDLYNIAMEYKITRDDYFSLGLEPLDALVGPSVNISKDGQSILDTISQVTPVEEIQADHQVVLDCIQARVAFAEELSSSIKELDAIDMNKAGELVSCDTFESSLEKVTAFVEENK